MRGFVDSSKYLEHPGELRAVLDRTGYVFLKGFLDRQALSIVAQRALEVLTESGWVIGDLESGRLGPKVSRESRNNRDYLNVTAALQSIQELHEAAHSPPLRNLMSQFLGPELLVHPRKIVRLALPDAVDHPTPLHQDFRVVQGAVDVLTVWIPLMDCPQELGGLRILEGSARGGLLPVEVNSGPFGQQLDLSDDNPLWRHSPMEVGDILVFHSLTVHGGLPNRTERPRLSMDFRYQSLNDPVITSSLLPYYYPWIPGWEILAKGWSSHEAIRHPLDVRVAPTFDPTSRNMFAPPSRLVTVGGPGALDSHPTTGE